MTGRTERGRRRVGARRAGRLRGRGRPGPWGGPGRGALLLAALALAACGGGEEPADRSGGMAGGDLVATRTLGQSYLQEDRLDLAETEFRKLVEMAPDSAVGYAQLALVSLRRDAPAEAERQAREAVERAPEDPDVRLVLATALERQGRLEEAREELDRALESDPDHLESRWARVGLGRAPDEPPVSPEVVDPLRRIVERAPGSLPARISLARALLAAGRPDSALAHLEEVRSQGSGFPEEAAEAYDEAVELLRGAAGEDAAGSLARFHDAMRTTARYQADLQRLQGPRPTGVGFPELAFSYEISVQVPDVEEVLATIRYTDASAFAELDAVPAAGPGDPGSGAGGPSAPGEGDPPGGEGRVFVADVDGDRDGDLLAWTPAAGGRLLLLRNDLGRFVDITAESGLDARVGPVTHAAFGDYDDDGRTDLYLVRDGPNALYRSEGDGLFRDVTEASGTGDAGSGRVALFVDVDHDGDLDIFVGNDGPDRLFRNDLESGFTEVAAEMGLAGEGDTRAAAMGDLDGDARIDLYVVRADGPDALHRNLGQGRFREAAAEAGLEGPGGTEAVALGDFDNDGHLDLYVGGPGAEPALWRNRGDGTFERDRRSRAALAPASGPPVRAARFLDFDNDGHLDLLLAGGAGAGTGGGTATAAGAAGGGLRLLRNDGTGAFEDRSDKLPDDVAAVRSVAVTDYNEDGDLDLLVAAPDGRVRLLRNDGANANHHFDIRLVGRGPGSGKNNAMGLGSLVEVRAGDLYQARVVTDASTHFGLGARLKPDVIRILWTNGVPQYLYYPGTDQDLIESQTLKGSCAFAYTWDGESWRFHTDVMWRSALGMPVGLMAGAGEGTGRAYAPPGASREYLRIPGEKLAPEDGVYRIQLTEELWEVAYVDEVRLVAVDRPDSVELFVDERFVPPAEPSLRMWGVAERRTPVAARDGRGRDVLPELRAADDVYVSGFRPGRFQGLVETHDLVLELEEVPDGEPVTLFLNGWVFPTDASINVSVARAGGVEVRPPVLQVPDGDGGWRTVRTLGFPAGKKKTVVADLTGVLAPGDPRVRIRTNMEVYWDEAFYAVGPSAGEEVRGGAADLPPSLDYRTGVGEARLRVLAPSAADLHYRGFSREYRRGGRDGPHWFDYDDVSETPRWLPIPGRYTRYGDVRPLLDIADDRYVVMGPGDEVTLEFAAGELPEPPEGWRRDFLLYTDGWIKDADMNTAAGHTVSPLPFHGMREYPYGPGESFPDGPAHREWLETYQTRVVEGGRPALGPGPPPLGAGMGDPRGAAGAEPEPDGG